MKRQLLSLALCLSAAAATHAQEGNTGFGVPAPTTKVDVNGAVTFRQGTAVTISGTTATLPGNLANSQYIINGGTAAYTISAPNTGSDNAAPFPPIALGARMVIVNNSGFAGTLNGFTISSKNAVEFVWSNLNGTPQWVATNNSGTAARPDYDWMKAGNLVPDSPADTVTNIYHIGGNVGIGTAAPSGRLTVSNNGGGNGSPDDVNIVSYGAATNPAINFFTVRGTEASPAPVTTGVTPIMSLNAFAATAAGSTYINAIENYYSGTGAAGSNLGYMRFLTSAQERMHIAANGYVGINTSAPSSTLQVNAYTPMPTAAIPEGLVARFLPPGGENINSSIAIAINERAFIGYKGEAEAFALGQTKHAFLSGNNGTDVRLRVITNNLFNDSALVVASEPFTSGFVGLGTSLPTANLDVNGRARVRTLPTGATADFMVTADADGNLRRMSNGAANGNFWSLTGNTGTNPATNYLGTTDAQALSLRTNGIDRIRVGATGFVGLSSSNPLSALDIVNDGAGGGGVDDINLRTFGATTGPVIRIVSSAGSLAAPANLASGTNIGEFSMVGRINGANAVSAFMIGQYVGDGTTNQSTLRLGTSGSPALFIDENGSTGAGTSTPDAKLDVAGDFKLGTNGTVRNAMLFTSATLATALSVPTAAGAGSVNTNVTFPLAGATPINSTVMVSPVGNLPANIAIAYARVSSTGNVSVYFVNTSSAAISIPVGTVFNFTVIQ